MDCFGHVQIENQVVLEYQINLDSERCGYRTAKLRYNFNYKSPAIDQSNVKNEALIIHILVENI